MPVSEPATDDKGRSLALDRSGNVIRNEASSSDFSVIKLDGRDGSTLWRKEVVP